MGSSGQSVPIKRQLLKEDGTSEWLSMPTAVYTNLLWLWMKGNFPDRRVEQSALYIEGFMEA